MADAWGGLLPKALDGDEQARCRLLDLARDRVLGWCRRLGLDTDAAEDAAQEVLVRAWEHLDSVADVATFGSWLYAVTLNVVRARSREPSWSALDFEPRAREPRAALEDARAELLAMLEELPEAEREIIAMRYGLGLSGEEIASHTGVAHGAARARLYRALRHLRILAGGSGDGTRHKRRRKSISGDGNGE